MLITNIFHLFNFSNIFYFIVEYVFLNSTLLNWFSKWLRLLLVQFRPSTPAWNSWSNWISRHCCTHSKLLNAIFRWRNFWMFGGNYRHALCPAIKINKCRQEWRTFHFHFRFQIQMTVISWELLFVRNGCFPGNFKVIAAMAKGFGNFKYPLYESKSNHLQCA